MNQLSNVVDKKFLCEMLGAASFEHMERFTDIQNFIDNIILDECDEVVNNTELEELLSCYRQSLKHLDDFIYCLRYNITKAAANNISGNV